MTGVSGSERVVVTGGAGFIGTNLVARLVRAGHQVTVFDDFSRPGAYANLQRLIDELGESPHVVTGDLADPEAVDATVTHAQRVYHLAGQVAVTTSVVDPMADFRANALGTFHVLDAARRLGDDPIVLYASTNKVYGSLDGLAVEEQATRWVCTSHPAGLPETWPLDPHSPYGCSKAAGDVYTRDHHRTFGLRTVVLRQSCVVGPRQLGAEDQGWVAWLLAAARYRRPITIFGDGKQVRDVLDVDDLLDAYDAVVEHIDVSAGEVFNVGGGPANSVSVWCEFGPMVADLLGTEPDVGHASARTGDQRVFVADTSRLRALTGWTPRRDLASTVARVDAWIAAHPELFVPG